MKPTVMVVTTADGSPRAKNVSIPRRDGDNLQSNDFQAENVGVNVGFPFLSKPLHKVNVCEENTGKESESRKLGVFEIESNLPLQLVGK